MMAGSLFAALTAQQSPAIGAIPLHERVEAVS